MPTDHRAGPPFTAAGGERTALLVLISGRFRVDLPGHDVVLTRQGDYVVWGKGVDHS
nr:hypothetical protein [Sinosporangium album]